jgi:RNA polymerase sigma-70 factor, ECF subfamily
MNAKLNNLTEQSEFAEATLEHLDALYGFAIVLCKDCTVAADLVQETYVHALRSWKQFTPGTQLKSWMFVILRNIWINQYRRDHKGPQFLSIEDESNDENDYSTWLANDTLSEISLIRAMQVKQVQAAVQSLPGVYREVVMLRDMDGFSYREIAAILHCAEGTVMSRLSRARQQLRTLLAKVI